MSASRKIFFLVGFAYLLFVVYGSLVPLDFHPQPFDLALRNFSHIRYLQLGMDSRADWVANILLYIPLPYVWLGCISRRGRVFRLVLSSFVIFVFCVALSLAIEFTQQFFPPRTVSLNDIIAEILGTAIGIVLWWASGERLRNLVETLFAQGKRAAYAGLFLYAIGYMAFSLFPYDFLISAGEISGKFSSNYFHWFASQSTCGSALRCGAKLIAEAATVAPLGLLFGFVSSRTGWPLVRSAAWIGFWLGLSIETLQFFLVSGLTLGASVFTRVIGVAVGAASGQSLRRTSIWPLLYLLRPFMPLTIGLYILLAAAVTWLGKGPLLSLNDGLRRLSEIRFMPFYYHYYTSESAAMASLFGVAIMFFPIGVQYWIWHVTQLREFVARGTIKAVFLGGVISSGVEVGKLFLNGARPDPTNVLIGSLAAGAGFICVSICTRTSLSLGLLEGDDGSRYTN